MKKKGYPGQTTQDAMLPKILGAMPLHTFYIEGFAGTCSVYKNKAATRSLLIDMNEDIVKESLTNWKSENDYELLKTNTIDWLASVAANSYTYSKNTFVFLDPPWRHEHRADKQLYTHEMTDQEHTQLLINARALRCNCAILHNRDAYYDAHLPDWNVLDLNVSFRGKVTAVALYMNYDPEIEKPHNKEFVGRNRTHRQQLKRKAERWYKNFRALPVYEQQIIYDRLKVFF